MAPKPTRLDSDLIPFFNQKNSLCVENDVILLQREGVIRVVIPSSLRKDILHLLHEVHWRATRTKQMARRYVWWPNINGDVENLVQSCLICRQTAKAPVAEFKSWPKTPKP